MVTMNNNQELIEYISDKKKVKYLFFWGHRQNKSGVIDKSCLSQWYPAPFLIDDCYYPTAEHYMMAEKARLFNDNKALNKILKAQSPDEAKQLGRAVNHFDEQQWIDHRFNIVVRANYAKFSQNIPLRHFLVNTGDKIVVEASPVDKIWGIGLAIDHEDILQPKNWRGLNLLGYALMNVRCSLIK